MTTDDRFAAAAAVANAVAYEGYVLYPYRATSVRNQCRWQFGVVAPPAYAAHDGSERSTARAECIVAAAGDIRVFVRVRLLHLQRRTIQAATPDGGWREVAVLDTGNGRIRAWDEAVEVVLDVPSLAVPPSGDAAADLPIDLPVAVAGEDVTGHDGDRVGRVVRTREPLTGSISVRCAWADADERLLRVSVAVANTSSWFAPRARRDDMVCHALVAVHAMLGVDGGTFMSSIDPPPHTRDAVHGCRNEGMFPVLASPDDDVMLASPIILYDHPAVAPESPGDLYDATEIDELLALRVVTLSPDEKDEARALDPRARAIIDRCDELTSGTWNALHGAIRSFGDARDRTAPAPPWDEREDDAAPGDEQIVVRGVLIGSGAKVVVRPRHRADAQDLFVDGRVATVAGVHRDVNGVDVLVAVTIDADPASELLRWHGRHLYFHPDEIEPLDATGAMR